MDSPIVECIPNFSEARKAGVIDTIVQAIKNVEGVYILDKTSDVDHNRSVITFAGAPDSVEEAVFQAIKTASQLIDLDHHIGEHPRIGATDVVPFVPIQNVTMQECIEMAYRLGKRVGRDLNIPVYLYEEAATRPDRKNLEDIRRGEYEVLKEEIRTNPDRAPDFGPSTLTPAGATVIGARNPLIAFNTYLSTSDVSIAKNIAKAIRHSSGGLRYVKALGLFVDGLAQVSMNLTNYHATPISRVLEAIRSEASRYGTTIHHCELIGLIPQDALVDTAVWYSQLDVFTKDQILERRLASALKDEPASQQKFLTELASADPTPGGGAASAYAGAMAAALVSMVGLLTLNKKKYQEYHPVAAKIVDKANTLRYELSMLVEKDSQAYQSVLSAIRLPRTNQVETEYRTKAIQEALLLAAQVPLQVAQITLETWQLCLDLAEHGASAALSDIGSATALAKACYTAAHLNVQTNIKGLSDTSTIDHLKSELTALDEKRQLLEKQIISILAERDELFFI